MKIFIQVKVPEFQIEIYKFLLYMQTWDARLTVKENLVAWCQNNETMLQNLRDRWPILNDDEFVNIRGSQVGKSTGIL